MPPSESSTPLTPPKQGRSRRTLERIVQASLEILEREGPEALTVQAIVEGAGSSVGSFYARFRGKDDLLDYLGERVWREAAGRWDESLASRDWGELELAELAEGSARLLVNMERSRTSYLKALDRVSPGRDGGYGAFRVRLMEGLEAILLSRRQEIDHLDPVFAVRVGLRAVLGVVDGLGEGAWGETPLERVVHECRELLVSYLQPMAPRSEIPPGQVDFFDIWA